MTELEGRSRIDPQALDCRAYLMSLLAEGQCCGLVSDRDMARLRAESLTLLSRQGDTWSRGQSSSLPVEKAQLLLESVFYTAGLALKAAATPETALVRLREEPLAQLYAEGQKRIVRKLQTAHALHRQLKKTLFTTPNEFYRPTAVEGIDGFFKLYRPDLTAQETHITADYPTFFGPPQLDGIEFIEQYLQQLAHENRFCRYFAPEAVHALLLGLDQRYPQLILNLYGPVLAAALGCVITRQPVAALRCDLPRLQALLTGKSRRETEALLAAAAETFIAGADCPAGLAAYLRRSVPLLAADLVKNLSLGRLEMTVPCPVEWKA